MNKFERFTFAAALVIAALAVHTLAGSSDVQATPMAACDMQLRVELTPDVPDPRDQGFVSSLLGDHPDYRLTLLRQDPENTSVIALDLNGPGPAAQCREVVNSMRKDARVAAVHVQRDAASTVLPVNTVRVPGTSVVSTVQPIGTMRAGPDGDWVLKRSSGVSYAQQARIRYQCDIWAVDQTGFDPTESDGGVPLDQVAAKRADYLRAEAACFEAHGYTAR